MESIQARIAEMEAQLEYWSAKLAELLAMTHAVEDALDSGVESPLPRFEPSFETLEN
jgi:hypothetical protein